MNGPRARVFLALAEAGVRYLVVGGVAVVLHGHLRATVDLDLVLDLEPGNTVRALDALLASGFRPVAPVPVREFADPTARERWAREKQMVVFSLWTDADPTFKVDLFVEEPFDFAAAWERAAVVDLAGVEVRVASLSDLLEMKRRAGRAQDLADVAALAEIAR